MSGPDSHGGIRRTSRLVECCQSEVDSTQAVPPVGRRASVSRSTRITLTNIIGLPIRVPCVPQARRSRDVLFLCGTLDRDLMTLGTLISS